MNRKLENQMLRYIYRREGNKINFILKKLLNNKLIKNFTILLCTDGIVSVITMINTIMVINSIGTEKNGMLIMVQTFVTVMATIFSFSAFNGLITYLPKYIANKDYKNIKKYILQSFYLEIFAGVIAFVIGQVIISTFATIMCWDKSIVDLIRIYLITVILNVSGLASAIIRLYDKFKYLSYVNITNALLRIVGYLVGFLFIKSLFYFVIIEIFIDIISKILYLYFMNKVLKRENIRNITKEKLKFDKEYIKFSFLTNISQTLDVPVTYLGIFIINRYLGFSSSTVYNLIEKIGNIFGKLSRPIQQIIYPQITTWISENKISESIRFSKRVFLIINGIGVVASIFVMFTHSIWLDKLLPEYDFYVVLALVLYLLFVSIANSTQSIHAYFLAFKLAKLNLYILFVVNVIYIMILFIFTKEFRIVGVVISRIIQSLAVVLTKSIVILKGNYLKENTSSIEG